jgi:hypothetical protein
LARSKPEDRPFWFHLDFEEFAELSVVDWPFKLIHRKGRPTNLLFDIEQDGRELENLESRAEIRRSLLVDLIRKHNSLNALTRDEESVALDGRVLADLAALGYVDAGQKPTGKRRIPSRLRVFDARVHGLFGSERPGSFATALSLAEESVQKLNGWVHRDGAVSSESEASVVLGVDPRASVLALWGDSPGPTQLRIEVRINDEESGGFLVNPGSFRVEVPLPASAHQRSHAYVDVVVRDADGSFADTMSRPRWERIGFER